MRNITLAIQEVVQWYPLGVALGIARHKLDEIKFNHPVAAKQCKVSNVYSHPSLSPPVSLHCTLTQNMIGMHAPRIESLGRRLQGRLCLLNSLTPTQS